MSVTTPGARLFVCYSSTGPAGPFFASSSAVLTFGNYTVSSMTPNTGVIGCAVPSVTVSGKFCPGATTPRITFSTVAGCPVANRIGTTDVTISPDGLAVTVANVSFPTLSTPASLFVCYTPNGTTYFTSGNVLLSMGSATITALIPSTIQSGCNTPAFSAQGRFCPSATAPRLVFSTDAACANRVVTVAVNVDRLGQVCAWLQRTTAATGTSRACLLFLCVAQLVASHITPPHSN
jgi:hypothetical protein